MLGARSDPDLPKSPGSTCLPSTGKEASIVCRLHEAGENPPWPVDGDDGSVVGSPLTHPGRSWSPALASSVARYKPFQREREKLSRNLLKGALGRPVTNCDFHMPVVTQFVIHPLDMVLPQLGSRPLRGQARLWVPQVTAHISKRRG